MAVATGYRLDFKAAHALRDDDKSVHCIHGAVDIAHRINEPESVEEIEQALRLVLKLDIDSHSCNPWLMLAYEWAAGIWGAQLSTIPASRDLGFDIEAWTKLSMQSLGLPDDECVFLLSRSELIGAQKEFLCMLAGELEDWQSAGVDTFREWVQTCITCDEELLIIES